MLELQEENCRNLVEITHFVNPHMFWFRYRSSPNREICAWESELQSHFFTASSYFPMAPYNPQVGDQVAAFIVSMDRWIRGKCERIAENGDSRTYIVWAIDYGKPYQVGDHSIRPIPKDLSCDLEETVFFAGVADIVPALKTFDAQNIGIQMEKCNQWSSLAVSTIEELINEAVEILFIEQQRTEQGQRLGDLLFIISDIKCVKADEILLELDQAVPVSSGEFPGVLDELGTNRSSYRWAPAIDTGNGDKYNGHQFAAWRGSNEKSLNQPRIAELFEHFPKDDNTRRIENVANPMIVEVPSDEDMNGNCQHFRSDPREKNCRLIHSPQLNVGEMDQGSNEPDGQIDDISFQNSGTESVEQVQSNDKAKHTIDKKKSKQRQRNYLRKKRLGFAEAYKAPAPSGTTRNHVNPFATQARQVPTKSPITSLPSTPSSANGSPLDCEKQKLDAPIPIDVSADLVPVYLVVGVSSGHNKMRSGQFSFLLDALSRKMTAPNQLPIFNYHRFSDGYFHMECVDHKSAEWMRQFIHDLVAAGNSPKFQILERDDVQFHQIIAWIAGPKHTDKKILLMLMRLNPTMDFSSWRIAATHRKVNVNGVEGFNVIFIVGGESFNELRRCGMALRYSFFEVRFYHLSALGAV